MGAPIFKAYLLDTMRKERQHWDALLSAIGPERMTQPCIAGHWSVKDVVVHITAYERWLVNWLEAASRHDFPPPSPLDDADIDQRNAIVYAASKDRSLDDALAEAQHTFQELLRRVETLSEWDLVDPKRTEWFVRPYWNEGTALWEAIINLSYDHYQEHVPDLQAWMKKAT